MARQKRFLNYKSVKLYRGLKGNVEQNFAYTKKPNNQIEGGYDWFDIRRVPRKYRRGLDIDPSYSTAFSATGVDQIEYERTDRMHREAHEEVFGVRSTMTMTLKPRRATTTVNFSAGSAMVADEIQCRIRKLKNFRFGSIGIALA